jgi:hypothetical protein
MATIYSPNIVRNGLILYYDAANVRSYPTTGTTLSDISGNGNNATLTAGVTFSTTNQGYFNFDTTAQRGTSTLSNFGTSMTWSAWINRTASANPFNMFMGRELPYFAFNENNVILFSNDISGSQRTITTPILSSPVNNRWRNVVGTTSFNGSVTTMSLYIDSILIVSSGFTGSQGTRTSFFTIGDGRSTTSWYPFNGFISNVSIYNRTLTQDEITQNFNALRQRYNI